MRKIAPHEPLAHHKIRPRVFSATEANFVRGKTLVNPGECGNKVYLDALEKIKRELGIENDHMAISILAEGVRLGPKEVYRQLAKKMPGHLAQKP
jgi:hypothetical protein